MIAYPYIIQIMAWIQQLFPIVEENNKNPIMAYLFVAQTMHTSRNTPNNEEKSRTPYIDKGSKGKK